MADIATEWRTVPLTSLPSFQAAGVDGAPSMNEDWGCKVDGVFYTVTSNSDSENLMYELHESAEGGLIEMLRDLLRRVHRGSLKSMEYRLCRKRPKFLTLPGFSEVHEIPILQDDMPDAIGFIAPEALASDHLLREDQQAALRFVLQAERGEAPWKTLRHTVKGFRQMDNVAIRVGCHASIRSTVKLRTLMAYRSIIQHCTSQQLQLVLSTPGFVTEVIIRDGDNDSITLSWTGLSLTVGRCCLDALDAVPGIHVGGQVRLLQSDAGKYIDDQDVGILIKLFFVGDVQHAEVCFPQWNRWEGQTSELAPSSLPLRRYVELRVVVEYPLHGSICAQQMGWGKTPLMAALLASCAPGSKSLVLVPPKVFRQWQNELCAWLGLQVATGGWLRAREAPRIEAAVALVPTAPRRLVIWAPVDMAMFKAASAEDADAADVVLLPVSIFHSKIFPSDAMPWPDQLFDVLCRAPTRRPWDRLIVDEAHELCTLELCVQRRLLKLPKLAVHALSGTPQVCGGSRGAASLAKLFGASICPSFAHGCFAFDADKDVTASAASFFASVARTQPSPFQLPITERLLQVQLSQAEKVLYTNAKQHESGSVRELLELCCGFLSESSGSAHKEIGVLIRRTQKQMDERCAAAKAHAALVLMFAKILGETARLASRRLTLRKRLDCNWQEGLRVVDELFERLDGVGVEQLGALLRVKHLQGSKTRAILLDEADGAPPGLEVDAAAGLAVPVPLPAVAPATEASRLVRELEKLYTLVRQPVPMPAAIAAAVKQCFNEQLDSFLGSDLISLGSVKKQLEFLQRSLIELTDGKGSCPICLDELENGEATCLTDCGHAFHTQCIEAARATRATCPTCRQRIAQLWAAQPPVPVDPWLRYGSKVKLMVRQLQEIMREFPGERLLLFAQHRDMRKKLERAFKEFSVPFLTLSGSARTQGAAITRWQTGEQPDDFLMMLSSEEHASGITLTRARHVMLAHPFWAETHEEAEAMERQALGRINRIGQLASSLMLWRVVTEETVEEELHKERLAANSHAASSSGAPPPRVTSRPCKRRRGS